MELLTSLYKDIFQSVLEQADYPIIQILCRIDKGAVELCNTKYKHIVCRKRREYLDARLEKEMKEQVEIDYDHHMDNHRIKYSFLSFIVYGDLVMVDYIIREKGLDPSFYHSVAVAMAVQNGREKIVKRLLEDPRIYPGGPNNMALSYAASYSFYILFDLILSDGRLNLNDPQDATFSRALELDDYKVMLKLLSHPEFDPSQQGRNYLISRAYILNSKRIVFMMLNDSRVYDTLPEEQIELYDNYIET